MSASKLSTCLAVIKTADGLTALIHNFSLFKEGQPVERLSLPLVNNDAETVKKALNKQKIPHRTYVLQSYFDGVSYYYEEYE